MNKKSMGSPNAAEAYALFDQLGRIADPTEREESMRWAMLGASTSIAHSTVRLLRAAEASVFLLTGVLVLQILILWKVW